MSEAVNEPELGFPLWAIKGGPTAHQVEVTYDGKPVYDILKATIHLNPGDVITATLEIEGVDLDLDLGFTGVKYLSVARGDTDAEPA